MTLNEDQQKLAGSIDGIYCVDAGPGTGKTHTVVRRYLNILDKGADPNDILLLTFTNNAAAEMEERVRSEMISSGRGDKAGSVRSSTFDSFCLKVVMDSPETVSGFFRTKEMLTRNASLIQNETLNQQYFRNVYTRFIRKYGHIYGNVPAVIGTSYPDLYNVIQKLMSIGVAPTFEGGWFGRDTEVLYGSGAEIEKLLNGMIGPLDKKYSKEEEIDPKRRSAGVTEKMVSEAVNDPRKDLLRFVHDVYYEFVRSSVSDNRLTFGLNALFAFIVLYTNKHVRKVTSFRYVMIDEFQDTNELQFMTSLLILKEPNLCVVGDWKQGIYGFRYASIDNILNFKERLKEMKQFLNKGEKRVVPGIADPTPLSLTVNFRSTQLIIDTSFSALGCRTSADESIDKELLSQRTTLLKAKNDHKFTGAERLCADSYDNEILTILQRIVEYTTDERYRIAEFGKDGSMKERRPTYGDIAVLCRTGKMCIDVKEKAKEYGISAHLQGDMDIMGTPEGKLALAWLRYVNDKNDARGPITILAHWGWSLAELERLFPKKRNTDGVPQELKDQRSALMKKRRRINDLMTSIFAFHGMNNDITQSIVATVSEAHANGMLTIPDTIRLIEDDMEKGSAYNVDSLLDGRSVTIQTMHKSKGLEYPIVIVGGLNVNVMPSTKNTVGARTVIAFDPLYGIRLTKEYVIAEGHHKIFDCWKWAILKNLTSADRDGERRLFFVALSRAKQYITMTCRRSAATYFIKDIEASPMTDVSPDLRRIVPQASSKHDEQPSPGAYGKRKRRIALHEIMGPYDESGGGKGAEHGIRVHKEAQRIMNGMKAVADNDETRYIQTLYDKMKGAKIITEADCSLPFEDTIIAGRIDVLAVFGDRVEVRDIKTDMNDNNAHRYELQLSVYAHCAASLGKPVHAFIDYVSRGTSVPVKILGLDVIYERACTL